MPETPEWLGRPELAGFWIRVRRRLEITGLPPRGRITVSAGSRAQRHALTELLGTSVLRERVVVDLAALDARLQERSGLTGLSGVVEAVTGSRLRDRPRERAARETRRQASMETALRLVDGPGGGPWVGRWLDGLRTAGLLSRSEESTSLIPDAVQLLQEILREPDSRSSRVELSGRVIGDAHALDEDSLLHQVVLRALAASAGIDVPTTVSSRRDLWASFGVMSDLVSATCLTLGLLPEGDGGVAARLRSAASNGDPVHLTAWDLRREVVRVVSGLPVLVCENPRVLEAVAESRGGDLAVVCTSGQPNTVVTGLLERLTASGSRLSYHGDFDWPGIAIANRMVAQFGVRPWMMTVVDYESGIRNGSLLLGGTQVAPAWDPELGAAMRARGRAVHEEAVLPELLAALPAGASRRQ